MPKPMKVLLASHSHELKGGAEKSLLEIAKSLQEDTKFDVMVALPYEGEFQTVLEEAGIKTAVTQYTWAAHISNKELEGLHEYNRSALADIYILIKSYEPDIIVSNTSVIPWFGYCAHAMGIPHFWFLRERIDPKEPNGYYPSPELYLEMIRDVSNRVLVNSKTMQEYYSTFFKADGIDVVYPTISKSIVKSARLVSIPLKAIELIVYGDISPNKGQMDAVEAARILRDKHIPFSLTIMGRTTSESYYRKVVNFINKHDLESFVRLLGHHNNPNKIVAEHDVCVIPSVHETFGRATVEAMLLGKTVVASNTGGSTEIINDKKTGLLYTQGSPESLADKILYLYNNQKEMVRMAEAGMASAKKNYLEYDSIQVLKDRMLNFNLEPLERKRNWITQLLLHEAVYSKKLWKELVRQKTLVHERNIHIVEMEKRLEKASKELADIKSSKAYRVFKKLQKGAKKVSKNNAN